jgi:NAD dependent epimerase/dehydratase family enzyme
MKIALSVSKGFIGKKVNEHFLSIGHEFLSLKRDESIQTWTWRPYREWKTNNNFNHD